MKRALPRVRFFIIPAALFPLVGPRVELIGLSLGILLLLCGRKWGILATIGAGLVAVGFGFQVRFITDPTGGYFFLHWLSIPFTFGWIVFLIRAREALRRGFPRRGTQLAIDGILVFTALLLGLASPQAHTSPIALYLPFASLLFLILETGWALRGGSIRTDHSVVAFGLALFGVSGAMKGAVSISLLGPLAAIGVPLFATAQVMFVSGGAGDIVIPRFFSRRFSRAGFILTSLLLTSAFAVAAVSFAQGNPGYALVPAAALPVLWVLRRNRARFRTPGVAARGGRKFIFGVGFDDLTLDAAVLQVERLAADKTKARIVVTPNSASLIKASKAPDLFSAYAQADLVIPDGIGVIWASRLFGTPLSARVTGVDLAERLLSRAGASGTRVFFLGGRPGVAARAAARLKAQYPGLTVVGAHHGYFADDNEVIGKIAGAKPDLVLVGMGVPRQERFMLNARGRLAGTVMIGVGGALDLFAGDCRRAPKGWQQLGLEWFYRLIHDPRRIVKVLLIPRFIGRALSAWVILSTFRLASEED